MMTKLITQVVTKIFFNKSLISIILLISSLASSNTIAQEATSISYGELSKNLTPDIRKNIASKIKNSTIVDQVVDQHIGKASGKTRTEILTAKSNTKLATKKALTPTYSARNNTINNPHYNNDNSYADFSIYGATTLLQEDYDNDGFYQTFSVIFDADIVSYTANQLGEVYAFMYISKNGGPWTHYYTTDNFLIEGDTDLDEYEVVTTFLSGYSTDYYDILIDLYQEGYNDVVATYSSDDSNALYALPLESADYDEPYIEVNNGGSFSVSIILLFLIVCSVRLTNNKS
jgi:hypothetical protein